MIANLLTKKEIKLMSILAFMRSKNIRLAKNNISNIIKIKLNSLVDNWQSVALILVTKEYIVDNGGDYTLTNSGNEIAANTKGMLTEFFYDEFYEMAEKSLAHQQFCTKVYGKNLCQHGMADMEQLRFMIENIKANNYQHILEIGCGNGMITEYISDITKTSILGIDISKASIQRAIKRTENKHDRLAFMLCNAENINELNKKFDAILAIDSLYYVKDLTALLSNMTDLVRPKGSMYIYYAFPPKKNSTNNNSKLDIALSELGLTYQAIDFTESNKRHWTLKKQILQELKHQFEAEKSMFLYNNRIAECEGNIASFNRSLYIVNTTFPLC